jgi:hypothetical protein
MSGIPYRHYLRVEMRREYKNRRTGISDVLTIQSHHGHSQFFPLLFDETVPAVHRFQESIRIKWSRLDTNKIFHHFIPRSQICLLILDAFSSIQRRWLPGYFLPPTPLPQHILKSRVIRNARHWLSVESLWFPLNPSDFLWSIHLSRYWTAVIIRSTPLVFIPSGRMNLIAGDHCYSL